MVPEIDAQPKPKEAPVDDLLVDEEDAVACSFEGEPEDWQGMKPEMEIVVEGVSASEIDEETRDQIAMDIIDYLLTSTDLSVEGVTIPCRD